METTSTSRGGRPAAASGGPTGINPTAWSQAHGFEQGQLRLAPTALLTIAAQGPLDERGRLVHEDDPAAQLALALANVEGVLAGAGMTSRDLVQLRVYTTDLDALADVYDTLLEHLAEVGATPPTTLVEVSRLPVPGMTVALEGLAIPITHGEPCDTERTGTSMTTETTLEHPSSTVLRAEALRGLCAGAVHLPGDPGYDQARMPWNVAVDQRPAAVAFPHTAAEAAEVVLAAAAAGLRVAPQSTGHAAGPLAQGDLADVVIVRTSEMTDVSIDPVARIARAEGGALWQDVVEAAAPHGLAALHGSSPDVGVAGYSLGGGMGWYARKLGLATNSITAVELVTADGSTVRADARSHTSLFWALRGGGGNFGLVTALEFRLYPIADAYAGMLLWDRAQADAVVRAWAGWSASAPDEVTTSLRVMSFPPMPELPDFLRGRQVVIIDGAVLADDADAEELLAPLRALSPELDTFGRVPAASLSRLHMDPEGPTPAVSDSTMLSGLPDEAIDAFLAEVGPGTTTSLLAAELRQLGGALARKDHAGGALPRLDAAYAGFFVGIAATPEMAARSAQDAQRLVQALEPWSSGRTLLNFAERQVDLRTAYGKSAWTRLQTVRSMVDPEGIFVANHRISGFLPGGPLD